MSKFQELQNRHLALLARYEQDKESEELLADVKTFAEQVVATSKEVSSSRERNQIRANLRFWGAFIYDHTKVYPNLTLLPSEKKTPPSRIIVGILGGVGLLLIVFIAGYGFMFLPRQAAQANRPAILNPMETEIAATLTALAMSEVKPTETFTPLPTKTPLLTNTPTLTPLPLTPTSPPQFSPTPLAITALPVETEVILIPITGGGGSNIGYDQADCSSRTLTIKIFDPSSSGEPVTATLFRSETGEVVARRVVGEYENEFGSTQFTLDNPIENATYLLQVRSPVVQYEMMILQFLSNCTRNNTVVIMMDSFLISEQPFDPQLLLLTWGASYPEPAWLAKLKLINVETGIFWLVDMVDPDNPVAQPIEDAFTIKGNDCEAARFEIVETTNGIYKKQEFVLYSPMSFCPNQ